MKRILLLCFALLTLISFNALAQKTVTGKVTDESGEPLPGVNVLIKGTTTGAQTDLDGNFRLAVDDGATLVFSYVGFETQEITVGSRTTIDVTMGGATELQEVVVTALGVERSKASLGYAVQEVGGEDVAKAKEGSFISSLSGKVAGAQISKSNNIDGSINVLVRGSSSLTKGNQALFVVDGVLISNSNINTSSTAAGGGGYDYGNAASDIDPESIASISVLKGAAAAALYGSDAANGVVLITTKKGKAREGIGVTVNHSTSFSKYDKDTFPIYQKEYGAGYGPYYSTGSYPGLIEADFDGDTNPDLIVPGGEDASFGQAYDENLMVYQWDSFYPQLDTYGQPRAWTAAENGPETIFETGVANITSVSFNGGSEAGTFRVGYTRDSRTGILPNSSVDRNVIDFNSSYNLTDKLTVNGKVTFTNKIGKGRYGTGYDSRNVMQSFRQWFQTNVDLKSQEAAYMNTRQNITWNPNGFDASVPGDLEPHYFDNPYWTLYENYQNDERNRIFSVFSANYEVTDWLSAMVRAGVDNYTDLQEERIAKGSLDLPLYSKYQRTFRQNTLDFILNFNKELTSELDLSGLVGFSRFNQDINSTRAQTNGGLVVDRLYSLSNSVSQLQPPTEYDATKRKYRYYTQISLGYNDMLYLDGTFTRESSSTLPEGDNVYYYPGVSLSFVFSEVADVPFLDFGKIRASWASVGNDTDPYNVNNTFTPASPFGNTPVFRVNDVSNNAQLKPEISNEIEFGIETAFLSNRAGFQVTYYKRNTTDQIFNVQTPVSTGFNSKFINAGEIENKGIEVVANGTPVKSGAFSWNVTVNWAKNTNTVIALTEGIDNLLLYSQWSTAINARVGQPYGTITGTDYVYTNGQKTVGTDGKYLATTSSTEIIGNLTPDWIGGIQNSFSFKGVSLGFLIDVQKGGDVLNYDWAFGNATGLYATTAGLNELGNPVRDPVADDGGVLLEGVQEDGSPNTIRAEAGDFTTPFGYYGGSGGFAAYAPDAQNVFDASFVKLREVTITYSLPTSLFANTPVANASLGVYGRNLWIIHKNLPYGDPEYNTSSGNIRGIQNAAMPAVKEFGFNVRVQF